MSSSTAEREGSERSGSSASTKRWATGDTVLSMPGMAATQVRPATSLKLMAIGTAAGLFSGIFGVGGGTVIVPLLVLWLGYGEREATGTSLAAIVFIAAFAAAVQAGYGNVRVVDGAAGGGAGGRRSAAGGVAAAAPAQPHDRAAVRGGAGRERGGAAGAMIGAIAIGLAAGRGRGPAGRRRRRAVRPGPRDLHRPHPAPGGGDVAAGDRPGRAGGGDRAGPLRQRAPAAMRCCWACSRSRAPRAGWRWRTRSRGRSCRWASRCSCCSWRCSWCARRVKAPAAKHGATSRR